MLSVSACLRVCLVFASTAPSLSRCPYMLPMSVLRCVILCCVRVRYAQLCPNRVDFGAFADLVSFQKDFRDS